MEQEDDIWDDQLLVTAFNKAVQSYNTVGITTSERKETTKQGNKLPRISPPKSKPDADKVTTPTTEEAVPLAQPSSFTSPTLNQIEIPPPPLPPTITGKSCMC